MRHIGFEMLNCLAEMVDEGQPLNEQDKCAMNHISECKECYDKFCALLLLQDVTNETGYIELAEMFKVRKPAKAIEVVNEKVMAVISVVTKQMKNAIAVLMEQIGDIREGFAFEKALVPITRSVSEKELVVPKMEEAENEDTFVMFDPYLHELLIQIDMSDSDLREFEIYILLEEREKIKVPMKRLGTLAIGKLEQVPDADFQIYIERV
ncbi:MAG: hypothetical protein IKY23_12465 [Lachnospiraceae bacterium]|nr:hypothetical protein [Lachnospiraceae bacterium]